MLEIVFSRSAYGALQYLNIDPADLYCFDLELSRGYLDQKNYPDLAELRMRIQNGDTPRLWYSQDPDEMAGLWWLMAKLYDFLEVTFQGMPLPSYFEKPDGTVIIWENWGEVAPEEWLLFLPQENSIPRNFKLGCALEWQELERENTPLRAVVSGRLVSVAEDFYDRVLNPYGIPANHRKRR